MRDVHDLTNDEIVEAIANCGIFGVDVGTDLDDDCDPSPLAEHLALELGLVGEEEAPTDRVAVRLLLDRIWILANVGDPVACHTGTTICLTLEYWAKRLAHKTEGQCRDILYAGQSDR